MRILITGARGKVGAAAVNALIEAGHEVLGGDLAAPVFEGYDRGAHYVQADLTDAGDAFSVIRGCDAVIHTAAIPRPPPRADARGPAHRVPQQHHGDVHRRRGVRAARGPPAGEPVERDGAGD